jgi:hypothetical protein
MDQDPSFLKDFIKMQIQKNKKSPEKGTNESTPHIIDQTKKLIDGYLSLIKPCKQKLQEYENHPQRRFILNNFLKVRANAMGQDYGFGMIYLPAFVDYSEEDMRIVQKGTFKY